MTGAQLRSDLPTRFIAGLLMAAAASLLIYFGGWPFRLLVLAGVVVMLLEYGDMHRVPRFWSWLAIVVAAVLLMGGVEFLYPAAYWDVEISPDSFAPAGQGFAALGVAGLVLGLASRRISVAAGFLYVTIPAFALLVLSWTWAAFVFWVMIVTWATDIFAYFAGRSIGGPKLAPTISPNKTWAGLIGGMAGAGVAGAGTAILLDIGHPFVWLGAVMGLLAQGGDLYESWLKRRAGVKDSGRILPGHGGVLDRVDGLLPVALATFLLLAAGLWTG